MRGLDRVDVPEVTLVEEHLATIRRRQVFDHIGGGVRCSAVENDLIRSIPDCAI